MDIRNGKQVRWQNLEEVWFLPDDEAEFVQYIQKAVRGYLRGEAA